MLKQWRQPSICTVDEAFVDSVGSRPVAELLYRRGIQNIEAAEAFLTGGIDIDAPGLPDLDTGVAVVAEAVALGRRICVYGDYDTDGITSTTLLVSLLTRLGAHVSYHVPNRFKEGYGMNRKVVESLAQQGIGLILTCDCGIRNHDEVALARKLAMQVVVTDHHELGATLPPADAVINPKRLAADHPCYMLPGVGTAYLFARQLLRALDRDPADADRWLDLVAVGIIADVVPLHGANRELARRGLARINTSACTGLQALLSVAGLTGHVTEEELAFQVVPRLNAAGRLADASLGVRLLLADDRDHARVLAAELDQLNQERKKLTAAVVDAATAEVSQGAQAVLLYRPEWHEGVLGIAAGKLAEELSVPALLMSRKHGTNIIVGSARAPMGFALHEALEACSDHLLKHGGHAAAAGFSMLEDHFAAFRAAMLEEVRRRTRREAEAQVETADLTVRLAEVDREFYDHLRRAGPFGEANPAPLLFSPRVKVLSARPIGTDEKHLRLVLRDGEQAFTGVWWNAAASGFQPQEIDLYYRIGLNRWNGEELLQVLVEHAGSGLPPLELVQEAAVATEAAAETEPLHTAPATAPLQAAEAAVQYVSLARPLLIDRRGADARTVALEFGTSLLLAEGSMLNTGLDTVDRYGLRGAGTLVLLSPPPSPRVLEEGRAITGADRVVFAWSSQPEPAEERFLPTLMRHLADVLAATRYVRISQLAVVTGELEPAVRYGLLALEESDLLAIEEQEGDRFRLRRRTDGRGVKESKDLVRMRKLIAESRAFRRFLRTAPLAALEKALF